MAQTQISNFRRRCRPSGPHFSIETPPGRPAHGAARGRTSFSPPAVYRAARAAQVALPTLPSTVRPRLRWNAFTAVSVLLPK